MENIFIIVFKSHPRLLACLITFTNLDAANSFITTLPVIRFDNYCVSDMNTYLSY